MTDKKTRLDLRIRLKTLGVVVEAAQKLTRNIQKSVRDATAKTEPTKRTNRYADLRIKTSGRYRRNGRSGVRR